MSVRIGRLIVDTMLPAALRFSSGRAETGAIATSDSSGNSPLESRYRLSAPPQTLTITSLTVAPPTRLLIARTSSREKLRPSNTRCGETLSLKRVCGTFMVR